MHMQDYHDTYLGKGQAVVHEYVKPPAREAVVELHEKGVGDRVDALQALEHAPREGHVGEGGIGKEEEDVAAVLEVADGVEEELGGVRGDGGVGVRLEHRPQNDPSDERHHEGRAPEHVEEPRDRHLHRAHGVAADRQASRLSPLFHRQPFSLSLYLNLHPSPLPPRSSPLPRLLLPLLPRPLPRLLPPSPRSSPLPRLSFRHAPPRRHRSQGEVDCQSDPAQHGVELEHPDASPGVLEQSHPHSQHGGGRTA